MTGYQLHYQGNSLRAQDKVLEIVPPEGVMVAAPRLSVRIFLRSHH